MTGHEMAFADVVARACALIPASGRAIVGICGAPGSGKTTLARALVATLGHADRLGPGGVAHVPMDGFHLADVELRRLGLLDRKGAAATYDANGYAALLARLKDGGDQIVYAPAFERELEQPLAGAIPVTPSVRLVVTEGNYLLRDEPAWVAARAHLDEVWFCRADDVTRQSRLVARHEAFGKGAVAARAWVAEVDEPNAAEIVATEASADVVIEEGALEHAHRRLTH